MTLSESSGVALRRPLHRRHNSTNSPEPMHPPLPTSIGAHSRSKTERIQHPLGKGSQANSSAVTRPNLARAMGNGMQDHDGYNSRGKGKGRAEDYEEATKRDAERTVIVHEVTATDSLAGIALKYGLSVAELCRANGMWPKDSVHLRKVLYIPLDKSAKYMLEPLIDLSGDGGAGEGSQENYRQSAIKRIPEWKLSFFPPSTSSTKPFDSPDTPTLKHQRYATIHTNSNSASLSSPHSLSNLFSSIPIVARLSFDSTTTSSDDAEVELDHVRPEQHHTHTSIDHSYHHATSQRKAFVKPRPTRIHHSQSIPIVSSSSTAPIQTVQLAPQPEMQLPLTSKSRSQTLSMTKTPTEFLLI